MKTRIHFLDNLRTFLIFLVVVLHSGLVYESVLENTWIVVDPVKNNSIGIIRMYLDLFVMFCIFFISGYFVRSSVLHKSSVAFFRSKFKRIFLPWLIAVFTLIPAYKFIFLHSRALPQEKWFTYFHFFERSGTDLSFYANNPNMNWLWFLPVLFLFQIIYLVLHRSGALNKAIPLQTAVILTLVFGVLWGIGISELGLTGWADTPVLHFQRERLLLYFMSFLLGALSNRLNVFESKKPNKKLYIAANAVLTVALGIFTAAALNIFFNKIDPARNFYFISDFADRLAYYISAVLGMLSFLYVLVHTFRWNLNKTTTLLGTLGGNSYSVYIVHTLVLGVLALALLRLSLPAYTKFGILAAGTFIVSNALITSYKKIKSKSFTMKTIGTFVVALLFTVAAFSFSPGRQNTPDGVGHSQQTSLHELVIRGDLKGLKAAIKNGADLNEKEPGGGSSPLITACVFGKNEMALELIHAGAMLNQTNNEGSTALHTAAFFCRTETVKALLENGIDKSLKNRAGSTAFDAVNAPFEAVEGIYNYFVKTYAPMGMQLDLNEVKTLRPEIARLIQKSK